jgi:DNA replication initiation complex subunit (GINS family)
MVELITYETLFEILQKEKTRKELQKLNKEFYSNFIKYLEEKTAILDSQRSKDSVFSTEVEKTEKQLSNIKRIIKELYDRRERKLTEAALFSARNSGKNSHIESSMLPEELSLYKEIKENITASRNMILLSLLEGKQPELKAKTLKSENKENNNILIKFLTAVPKFMGSDNFIYGPFEKEDIAKLPLQISDLLVNKQRAKRMEIE